MRAEPRAAVDLWVARTSELSGTDLVAACSALLSPDETARRQRLVFEKNRHEYLVTRALCRSVLATYVAEPATSLSFRANAYGRPELDPARGISFNLTNTLELVACAVSRDHTVGIDAEPVDRADTILEVAKTVFTERERAELHALDGAARRMRAVMLWTAKEAYMKARGMGMSLPALDFEIAFGGDSGAELRLEIGSSVDDDPRRWELAPRVLDGHVITTCIERRGRATVPVSLQRADLRRLLGVAS